MPYWVGPCFSIAICTQWMGEMKIYWAGTRCLIVISYRRMEEKDATLGRTSLSHGFFLQKNGGKVAMMGRTSFRFCFEISYRRMEEKDVIPDRPFSNVF